MVQVLLVSRLNPWLKNRTSVYHGLIDEFHNQVMPWRHNTGLEEREPYSV